MPAFRESSELLQEIDEMQAQVQRCKSILSGILMAAGEARGESSAATTLVEFLDDVVSSWRARRPEARLDYQDRLGEDWQVVADAVFKQMIFNLLDNAFEASPDGLRFVAQQGDDQLVLSVIDDGPGFPAAMLEEFGKPYQSSKGRVEGGLGLFLSVNVARSLGGSVSAANRPEGGAIVTVTLPLQGLVLPEEAHGGR